MYGQELALCNFKRSGLTQYHRSGLSVGYLPGSNEMAFMGSWRGTSSGSYDAVSYCGIFRFRGCGEKGVVRSHGNRRAYYHIFMVLPTYSILVLMGPRVAQKSPESLTPESEQLYRV